MASTLNKVELIGRLGKDPEVKNLTNGAVANFSVATSDVWKDRDGEKQEKTEWHNIVVWNEKTIEFIEKYLKKVDLVRIEGKIQTRKWKDQDDKERYTTEIVIPKFAAIEALMKLSFDNDNARDDGGSRSGSAPRGGRTEDRGGRNNDDRGGNNGGSRSTSRSASRDDRGSDDRGASGGGGGRSGGRAAARDDRPADDRDPPRRAVSNNRNADMDDDIPF